MSFCRDCQLLSMVLQCLVSVETYGLDGDTLGVDGAQVGVLKERDKV